MNSRSTHMQPIRFVQDFFDYGNLHIQNQIPANTGYAGFRVLYAAEPDRTNWTNSARSWARAISGCWARASLRPIRARTGAGLRRGGPAGGVSHLHRLVAGQAAARRHGNWCFYAIARQRAAARARMSSSSVPAKRPWPTWRRWSIFREPTSGRAKTRRRTARQDHRHGAADQHVLVRQGLRAQIRRLPPGGP